VHFSSGVVMLVTLLFESCLSCHWLHGVRTCPIDISTRCSSFMRLCPILLNIQSICPYLLKSPCTYRICPAVVFMLHQLLLRKVTVWKYFVNSSYYSETIAYNEDFMITTNTIGTISLLTSYIMETTA
jgi:hypothetical protein